MEIIQKVRGYIFNDKNQILFIKGNPKSRWILPGGHLEQGETLYQCLKRELKEEFNFDIEIFGEVIGSEENYIEDMPLPVAIFNIQYPPEFGNKTKVEYVFFADLVGGDVKVQQEEIFDYKWFDIDEVLAMDIETDTYSQIILPLQKNLDLLQ